jgi:Co/Zn/Cd efflux system component
LSLNVVPKNIDMEKIKEAALKIKVVRDIHHINEFNRKCNDSTYNNTEHCG